MLNNIFGSPIAATIDSIGNALDKIFTSSEEKLNKFIILERLENNLKNGQIEINKEEAKHTSLFVAGWRPFIGWVCGMGLMYDFLIMPFISSLGYKLYIIDTNSLHSLIVALLGLGSLRTFEKSKKVS